MAAEVRKLAQRSADAAKEIKLLINDSVEKVDNGSHLVDASGKALAEIVHSIKQVSDIIAEIAAASREQAAGSCSSAARVSRSMACRLSFPGG